jgi:hypothetical protein
MPGCMHAVVQTLVAHISGEPRSGVILACGRPSREVGAGNQSFNLCMS